MLNRGEKERLTTSDRFLASQGSLLHNPGAGEPPKGRQNTDRRSGMRIRNIFQGWRVGDGEGALVLCRRLVGFSYLRALVFTLRGCRTEKRYANQRSPVRDENSNKYI